MTWSYSGNPAASALDNVRFLIGDTDENAQQLSNEEITFLLDEKNNAVYGAAAEAARAIAAKYARRVDKGVGDLNLSFAQLQKHYMDMYERYKRSDVKNGISLYSGNLDKSTGEAYRQNDSLGQPSFTRDQFDNPDSSPNYGDPDVH